MKISELTEVQRGHMAWLLDHRTACGMLTAQRIARLELGDMEVYEVFQKYGGCAIRTANTFETKCARFRIQLPRHPVDALKVLGVPMTPEFEAQARAICDEAI